MDDEDGHEKKLSEHYVRGLIAYSGKRAREHGVSKMLSCVMCVWVVRVEM